MLIMSALNILYENGVFGIKTLQKHILPQYIMARFLSLTQYQIGPLDRYHAEI